MRKQHGNDPGDYDRCTTLSISFLSLRDTLHFSHALIVNSSWCKMKYEPSYFYISDVDKYRFSWSRFYIPRKVTFSCRKWRSLLLIQYFTFNAEFFTFQRNALCLALINNLFIIKKILRKTVLDIINWLFRCRILVNDFIVCHDVVSTTIEL